MRLASKGLRHRSHHRWRTGTLVLARRRAFRASRPHRVEQYNAVKEVVPCGHGARAVEPHHAHFHLPM
jgi:hypothetical protein